MVFSAFDKLARRLSRVSGTATTPTDGSIVQKGKFSAGTERLVSALNSVDFPTLGNPTIPIESDMFCVVVSSPRLRRG